MDELGGFIASYEVDTEGEQGAEEVTKYTHIEPRVAPFEERGGHGYQFDAHFGFEEGVLAERVVNADHLESPHEENQFRDDLQIYCE